MLRFRQNFLRVYVPGNTPPISNEAVKDFIDKLLKIPGAKLERQLDLLEEYGNELGMPHVKSLGDGLLELRVRANKKYGYFMCSSLERE